MPTCSKRAPLFDLKKVRRDFPMLGKVFHGHPFVYLDTAATSQKPDCVINAICHFYREEYSTVHRAIYPTAEWATERYSQVRKKIMHLIHAKQAEEIIFTRGTTESINLFAQTWAKTHIAPGDEIIISEMEHHANIVPWHLVCAERRAVLKIIPISDDGELDFNTFESLLNDKTKIVSVCHVANTTGTINPIKKLINAAHQVGAIVCVDGAQAISKIPVDVEELDVDFYAFSGHKLYGPTGIGVLYGKEHLLHTLPPFLGGGDMIETVTLEKTTFQHPPLRFEAGTPPIAQVVGLGAAIDYVEDIGIKKIRAWDEELMQYAMKELAKIDRVRIYSRAKAKVGIISFTLEGVHPFDLGTFLGLKGIAIRTGHLCAQPLLNRFGIRALARLSFGLYNVHEDVDRLIHMLKEAILLIKSPRG